MYSLYVRWSLNHISKSMAQNINWNFRPCIRDLMFWWRRNFLQIPDLKKKDRNEFLHLCLPLRQLKLRLRSIIGFVWCRGWSLQMQLISSKGIINLEESASFHFRRTSLSPATGRINCKVSLYPPSMKSFQAKNNYLWHEIINILCLEKY